MDASSVLAASPTLRRARRAYLSSLDSLVSDAAGSPGKHSLHGRSPLREYDHGRVKQRSPVKTFSFWSSDHLDRKQVAARRSLYDEERRLKSHLGLNVGDKAAERLRVDNSKRQGSASEDQYGKGGYAAPESRVAPPDPPPLPEAPSSVDKKKKELDRKIKELDRARGELARETAAADVRRLREQLKSKEEWMRRVVVQKERLEEENETLKSELGKLREVDEVGRRARPARLSILGSCQPPTSDERVKELEEGLAIRTSELADARKRIETLVSSQTSAKASREELKVTIKALEFQLETNQKELKTTCSVLEKTLESNHVLKESVSELKKVGASSRPSARN